MPINNSNEAYNTRLILSIHTRLDIKVRNVINRCGLQKKKKNLAVELNKVKFFKVYVMLGYLDSGLLSKGKNGHNVKKLLTSVIYECSK